MRNYNLSSFINKAKNYVELRIQDNRTQRIELINGNVSQNLQGSKMGVSARVLNSGCWGFTSATDITVNSIKNVIKSANFNSMFLQSKLIKNLKRFNATCPQISKSFATTKAKLNNKQKLDFLKSIDSYLITTYPKLKTRSVNLYSLATEKQLATSDGALLYAMLPKTSCYIRMVIEKNGQPYETMVPFYGLGEFEDVFDNPEDLHYDLSESYKHLVCKSEGVYAKAGYKECILDSKLAGMLAHEAIGHTTEADIVKSGSIASQYINKQIASPLISIVDFAHTMNGKTCPVPIYIDDEGTEAKDVTIIEQGILKNFMHNKESAQYYGVEPMGNARAYDFSDEPLIRMRNTVIIPGTSKLKDMISTIEDGYYLMQTGNGQADSTSEFMFGINLGYEIKNGKISKAIKDTTISGVATDVLQSVTMISDDMKWTMGTCGKKQRASVGDGGPAIKCKLNIGGV
ncbi:TldD/PmbA family protein [Clostridium sp. 'deep sea']|uniref:TldD/PmbA family protein n=1 Tax=Clostridium sp. 'deep sea' TaxID=2779445 RepID=UPI0018969567|nr:TldD/PmbA family protein [Clostridium sp. 'deep sea']QOR35543.1 TldD/PmbA family protein [Clostridium sp. 'deep sea']